MYSLRRHIVAALMFVSICARADCDFAALLDPTPISPQVRLLLGAGGFFGDPKNVKFLAAAMAPLLQGARSVLVIPYAAQDPDRPAKLIAQSGLVTGPQVMSAHQTPDPVKAVGLPTIMTTNDMPVVYPPSLQALGLVPIQINTHFVTGPFFTKEGEDLRKYAGETREDRIREFQKYNPVPVVGIPEATVLRVTDGQVHYQSGRAVPAQIFPAPDRNGPRPSVSVPPGSRLR